MILFAFDCYDYLVKNLPSSLKLGNFKINHFPNQEMYLALSTPVKNQDCLILGHITPPDENLLSFLLLAHTLKKEGAKQILAFIPYLAYARHDKAKVGESLGMAFIGTLLANFQITHVATIDIHHTLSQQLIPLPLESLSAAQLFAEEIKKRGYENATFVAPDEGAVNRVKKVLAKLKKEDKLVYFIKKRVSKGIMHVKTPTKLGGQAVVIDDILDTGSTLISTCQNLNKQGVQDIIIMVTHGLFTGEKWKTLWGLGVKTIYCTDSVPLSHGLQDPRIKLLSIGPIIKNYLKELAH